MLVFCSWGGASHILNIRVRYAKARGIALSSKTRGGRVKGECISSAGRVIHFIKNPGVGGTLANEMSKMEITVLCIKFIFL